MSRLSVVMTLLRGQRSTGPLAERLEAFYGPQASFYDATRENLLRGRRELVERLTVPEGGTFVDLGCGTGRNLEFFGDRLAAMGEVYLVDLNRPLLAVAEQRRQRHGWTNVHVVRGDSTTWRPPHPVDCVHLSYSLTMIPNWFEAIDNAMSMLKPGGLLGVTDFYIARPVTEGRRHGWLARRFWPAWFEHDGVYLSSEHLPYLQHHTETVHLAEERNGPLMIPYYVFVGRKR